ncbi:zinc finger protein CONSTANS-LIKE 2-like [Salvia divinorum]|uniref:Zinc finger protein CONSTANS-LIKE 2-like n=1 Tax=Salvia divinorum TaxID=28513 RepID=A0ABD1HV48_SALDI
MDASVPHNYCFGYPTDFCLLPNDAVSGETSPNMFNSNMQMQLPLLGYDVNSPVSVASFPDVQFGDYIVVPQMETGFHDFSSSHYNQSQVFDSGSEECSGSVWPPYNPLLAENWGIQGKEATTVEESDQVKVGRYSAEERKDRILRYLKKRNQRNFNKTIKYACRKTLADKRVRVRGRFAKNNEAEILMDAQQNNSFQQDDEDYWLQAAMDNLARFPYLAT